MTSFQTPTSELSTTAPGAPGPVPPNNAVQSTNRLLRGPILPTLTRLALPTVAVLLMTMVLGIAETYFVGTLGANAIAAASMVVPVMLTMTMVANGEIGGGVATSPDVGTSCLAACMSSGVRLVTRRFKSVPWPRRGG